MGPGPGSCEPLKGTSSLGKAIAPEIRDPLSSIVDRAYERTQPLTVRRAQTFVHEQTNVLTSRVSQGYVQNRFSFQENQNNSRIPSRLGAVAGRVSALPADEAAVIWLGLIWLGLGRLGLVLLRLP